MRKRFFNIHIKQLFYFVYWSIMNLNCFIKVTIYTWRLFARLQKKNDKHLYDFITCFVFMRLSKIEQHFLSLPFEHPISFLVCFIFRFFFFFSKQLDIIWKNELKWNVLTNLKSPISVTWWRSLYIDMTGDDPAHNTLNMKPSVPTAEPNFPAWKIIINCFIFVSF